MGFKKGIWVAAGVLFLGTLMAQAGQEGLAKLQTVPAGERIANYLQVYLTKVSTIVEAKSSGGVLEGVQTYRAVVIYDPDQKTINVSLIGIKQDSQTIQNMLEAVKDIILKLNPKLQKGFGTTLQESDLSLDYIYAKSGLVLARYRDGKYVTVPKPIASPSPQETSVWGDDD